MCMRGDGLLGLGCVFLPKSILFACVLACVLVSVYGVFRVSFLFEKRVFFGESTVCVCVCVCVCMFWFAF